MATISTLQTTIIRDLARGDTSLSDLVLIEIQSAVKEYEATRFYFNERSLSITLSSTNTYALSLWAGTDPALLADIIEVDTMSVLVAGSRRYDLKSIGHDRLRGMDYQPAQPTGNPNYYALWQQSIKIDTYPSPSITGTIDCHVRLVELNAPTDTNAWTTDGLELIRFAAGKRMHAIRYRDYEAAEASAKGEALALAALKRKTDALTSSSMDGYL